MSETPNTSSNPVSLSEGDALDPDSRHICPTCGRPLSDRTGDKSRWYTGGDSSKSGVGEGHGDRFAEDVTWFHYIPRNERAKWKAAGWKIKPIGRPHNRYSVLGEWGGAGPPVKP